MLDKTRKIPRVLTDTEHVNAAEVRIAEIEARIDAIEADAEQKKQLALAAAADEIAELDKEANLLSGRIRIYALGHRAEFIKKNKLGKRDFGAGPVGWERVRPKVITTEKDSVLIQRAYDTGSDELFVVEKPTLSRNAILAHPRKAEKALGVKVQGDTMFVVSPSGTRVRRVRTNRGKKWERRTPRQQQEAAEE